MDRVILNRKYADLLAYAGISAREALKKARLPEDLFSRKTPGMTGPEYFRFMEAIDELSADEGTPITMGTMEKMETFSPPIFAAYCSRNALTCIQRLARYKKLIGPLVFLVNQGEHFITVELTTENAALELPEFLVRLEMVLLIHLIRNATKEHLVPKEIMMRHQVVNPAYEAFFGTELKLGTKNRLTLSKEDAEKPFLSQNDAMWDYFEPELKKRLSELEVDDTVAGRVRSALIELLPGGQSSIEDVAEKIGWGKRTLQRKLNEEHTTYQKQLNHTRELLAKHYLKKTEMTTDDIAYLLGYQDLNSFLRAFNLWTGMTIKKYKRKPQLNVNSVPDKNH